LAGDAAREELEKRLAEMREAYVLKIPGFVESVEALCKRLSTSATDRAAAEALERIAHKLAGTSGTLGLADISAAAQGLERAAAGLQDEPAEHTNYLAGWVQHIHQLLAQLKAAAKVAYTATPDAPVSETVSVAGQPDADTGSARPAPRPRPKILAVDDDDDLLDAIRAMLGTGDYDVTTANNGKDALDLFATGEPDLVLLDLHMPDIDGYEGCAAMQSDERGRSVPVVFVTSASQEHDRARAFAVGAAGYLNKPVAPTALLSLVEEHLRTRKLWLQMQSQTASDPDERRWAAALPPTPGATGGIAPERFAAFLKYLPSQFPSVTDEQKSSIVSTSPKEIGQLSQTLEISDADLCACIAQFLHIEHPTEIRPEQVRLGVLPAAFSRANGVIAVDVPKSGLRFAVHNPFAWKLADVLHSVLGWSDGGSLQRAGDQHSSHRGPDRIHAQGRQSTAGPFGNPARLLASSAELSTTGSRRDPGG
jgi:two-component system, OmpR family, alkaline phosphatase synthesis response regulator PhoP